MVSRVALGPVVGLALCAAALATAQGATLVCESREGERAFCSADTSRGVTLQRDLGGGPCAGNWGFDEYGIWVANRCRAEFLLGQTSTAATPTPSLVGALVDVLVGGQGAATQSAEGVVVCESKDNRKVTCAVDTRGGVELQRQLSKAPCAGHWGRTLEGIWVDAGCRAEFKVAPAPQASPTPAAQPTAPAQAKPLQVVVCESQDNRRAFCSADTRGGVELQRQLGTTACLGHWGYDSAGIWVDNGCRAELKVLPVQLQGAVAAGAVVCASKDNRRAFCSADTSKGVTLVRQLSDASCLGHWGYDADGIWVDAGCRGEFGAGTAKPTPVPTVGVGDVLTCESKDNRRVTCPADIHKGVQLMRQLGDSPCVGHWGYDASGVWVDGGCRGMFSIR
jgi:hypothetical protein